MAWFYFQTTKLSVIENIKNDTRLRIDELK